MCFVIVCCLVDYFGWFNVYFLFVMCLFVYKGDGSLFVYFDGGSYKLLNWMSLFCLLLNEVFGEEEVSVGVVEVWCVIYKKIGDVLCV